MTGERKLIVVEPLPRGILVDTDAPVLFIDCDGVLFGTYGGELQLRPYVNSFLVWAQKNFRCFFLTGWGEMSIRLMLQSQYGRIDNIQYADWCRFKTEAIGDHAPDGNFFWLDDELLNEEAAFLHDNGWQDKHIQVDMEGMVSLISAIVELCQRAGVEQPEFVNDFLREIAPQG